MSPPTRKRSGVKMRKGSSKYDADLLSEAILKRIAAGEPILRVCAAPGMPSIVVINRLLKSPEFRERMEQAKAEGLACRSGKAAKIKESGNPCAKPDSIGSKQTEARPEWPSRGR